MDREYLINFYFTLGVSYPMAMAAEREEREQDQSYVGPAWT